MNKKSISIISILVNIILAFLKLTVGFSIKSAGLIADGIHSGTDILSSVVTYLGVKTAEKPADKEHPYGHYRSETIAGLVVVFLIFLSAVWIIYEGSLSIIKNESSQIGNVALLIVGISVVVNEVMARMKFKIGKREDSLAVIADGEHSRADSLSSIAVLIGLFATRFFPMADGVTAILVGLFIFYETWKLGKEVTDNLMDVSNPEIEKEIKEVCSIEEIEIKELKTRKIGAKNSAELRIGLNKEWKMKKVSEVIENLENILLQNISALDFITIQVVSHSLEKEKPMLEGGRSVCSQKPLPKIDFIKKGLRTIISYQNGNFYYDFGASEYLVIDRDKQGKIVQRKIVKNPYFVTGKGYGTKFAKLMEADKIITTEIGAEARKKLQEMGVEVEIKDKLDDRDIT